MTRLLKSNSGQATVLTVLALTVLVGMAALVLDIGSWYRAQRGTQAAADAAALAAAQALPTSTGTASAMAADYLAKNGGGNSTVTFSSKFTAGDSVTVKVSRPTPGFFAKLFGVGSVDVGATATARAAGIQSARWVAPIVVNVKHPLLNCGTMNGKPTPCFNEATELNLVDLHSPGSRDAAGSFGLINLDRSSGGNVGAGTLSEWVLKGFDQFMHLGSYEAAPSANFNNSQFQDALSARMSGDLLFPIYRTLTGPGSGAEYDIVGWVGFRVTSFKPNGSKSTVKGYFTSVIWQGIQSQTGAGLNYGVRAVQLVE
jgi:hypothetical protein